MTTTKTCAVMQPTYIPWIGYFDLIDQVDVFVFLDDVKLEKQSWQVRNRIKFLDKELMLSIPTNRVNGHNTMINESLVDDRSKWRKKHARTVAQSYSKAHFHNKIVKDYVTLLNLATNSLSLININIIKTLCRRMDINTEFVLSSDLGKTDKEKDDRVVDICKKINCNKYISPVGSKDYINRNRDGGAFVNSDVDLFYMNYKHPEYKQLGNVFIPYMSVLDLLLNLGYKQSVLAIKSGRGKPLYYKDLYS